MSLWTRLLDSGKRLFDSDPALDDAAAPGPESCAPDPNDVGFTAAVVGLGAKLAKADGTVSDREIMVFSRVFRAPPEEAENVRRVFNLARQTVRGYRNYARRIAKRYHDRPCLLEGVMDGLFQIAGADGVVTQDELEYLRNVSDAFGFSEATFRRIKASHLGPDRDDPYHILGVAHDADFDDIRAAYRRLMADNHPDRLIRMGVPREFEDAVHAKAAAITAAYAQIRSERGLITQPD
ncbi:MAG TPA: molecular chaperone DjiA [Hyphomonas sp.]|nr:molecular chaperone DjiA [Hyphomonas sp.]MCC0017661.1 molecular chaperone DjiA [Rhodobiaceae bacterium]MCA8906247.1 molecular chaperone DjiA [Hyphomonas sp.]MCB9963101.1 molecular chaperone DjiA [Hyphomonas sp.]MCB9972492.1 molecular chaperone DjiA [Hyphomonas sp.]